MTVFMLDGSMHVTHTPSFTSMLASGQHSPVGKDAHSQPNGSELLTRAFIDTGKPVVVLITWFTYSCTITLRKVARIGYLNSTTDEEKLLRI